MPIAGDRRGTVLRTVPENDEAPRPGPGRFERDRSGSGVERVDVERRQIDFKLAEEERENSKSKEGKERSRRQGRRGRR